MSDYKPVPVHIAQSIAVNFDKDQVVIVTFDRAHNLTHVTTYGVSAFDKENAAATGEIFSNAIGSDLSKKQSYEDFHQDYDPANYKEALELLKLVRNRQGTTPPMVQQAERILNAAGWGVRSGG